MYALSKRQAATALTVLFVAMLGPFSNSYAEQAKKTFGQAITVYKTPTCGCCNQWVDHLRRDGFKVTINDLANLDQIKAENGVPPMLKSCHTAVVEGYTVEGHVPMNDIWRLLSERPKIKGIAVPGMPLGSPGMESNVSQPYEVFTFGGEHAPEVFSRH